MPAWSWHLTLVQVIDVVVDSVSLCGTDYNVQMLLHRSQSLYDWATSLVLYDAGDCAPGYVVSCAIAW